MSPVCCSQDMVIRCLDAKFDSCASQFKHLVCMLQQPPIRLSLNGQANAAKASSLILLLRFFQRHPSFFFDPQQLLMNASCPLFILNITGELKDFFKSLQVKLWPEK